MLQFHSSGLFESQNGVFFSPVAIWQQTCGFKTTALPWDQMTRPLFHISCFFQPLLQGYSNRLPMWQPVSVSFIRRDSWQRLLLILYVLSYSVAKRQSEKIFISGEHRQFGYVLYIIHTRLHIFFVVLYSQCSVAKRQHAVLWRSPFPRSQLCTYKREWLKDIFGLNGKKTHIDVESGLRGRHLLHVVFSCGLCFSWFNYVLFWWFETWFWKGLLEVLFGSFAEC